MGLDGSVAESATIHESAVVRDPVVIGPDCEVGAGAVVDCVTGVGVTIGNGTTIPGGPGDVRVGDRVFEDEYLGALLSDRVEDDGGCTYVPGAVVGPEATIEAGATVRGTLAEGTEVRS